MVFELMQELLQLLNTETEQYMDGIGMPNYELWIMNLTLAKMELIPSWNSMSENFIVLINRKD